MPRGNAWSVREGGLEPPRPKARRPKRRASANSATPADAADTMTLVGPILVRLEEAQGHEPAERSCRWRRRAVGAQHLVPACPARRLRVTVRAQEPEVLTSAVLVVAVDVVDVKDQRLSLPLTPEAAQRAAVGHADLEQGSAEDVWLHPVRPACSNDEHLVGGEPVQRGLAPMMARTQEVARVYAEVLHPSADVRVHASGQGDPEVAENARDAQRASCTPQRGLPSCTWAWRPWPDIRTTPGQNVGPGDVRLIWGQAASRPRSRRSLATWPVALTLYIAFSTVPSSPMTNVERSTPMYVRP